MKEQVRYWYERGRNWRTDPLTLRFFATTPGQLVESLVEINVRDRALSLAGQAFIALVPLVVLLATWLSTADSQAVGNWIVNKFELTGSTAQAVELLFATPPGEASGISFIGLAILLISVNSFTRSLQRTFEVAWRLPERATGRSMARAAALVVLMCLVTGLTLVTSLVQDVTGAILIVVPAQVLTALAGWWLVGALMVTFRVPGRLLVPGAVISAVAQVGATWYGAIWIPYLIARNAERYGVIGVAVALISWLVVLAFIIVVCAAAGAWSGRIIEDWLARREGRKVTAATPSDA